jgi:hypothetical protein
VKSEQEIRDILEGMERLHQSPEPIRLLKWILDDPKAPNTDTDLLVQQYRDEIARLNKVIEKEVEWLTRKNATMAEGIRRLRRAL